MLAREGDRFISLLGTLARGDTLGGAGIRSWTKPARGVTTGIEGSSARGVSPCMVGTSSGLAARAGRQDTELSVTV